MNPTGTAEVAPDLEEMLVEVLEAVSGEPAMVAAERDAVECPHAMARLAIHDPERDRYSLVEVWLVASIARALASWMLSVPHPAREDVLDTVGELANILAGNVKTMLGLSHRLSLPEARLVDRGRVESQATGACRTALGEVLGQVVELVVYDDGDPSGLRWPGEIEVTRR